MIPTLPQDEKDSGRRYRQLAKALERYEFEPLDDQLVAIKQLPADENFSFDYQLNRLLAGMRFLLNTCTVKIRQAILSGRGLEEYSNYYPLLKTPGVVDNFRLDAEFAYQRRGGPNPMDLICLDAPPPDFPVTDEILRCTLGSGASIEALIAQRRLYLVDHSRFAEIARRVDARHGGRYLTAPKMLFAWPEDSPPGSEPLVPIAIQLRPTPAHDNPIFTPQDGADWLAAKIYAQVGDTTSHELCHHLANTHLLLEPIAIATHRRFAANHPLGLLLREHLRGTLAINELGRQTLINPGGFLDELMAGWLEETMLIVSDSVRSFHFDERGFPVDLARRGLDDPGRSPDFPYRDDGLLIWNAIRDFIHRFLAPYYTRPENLERDLELRRWLADLRGPAKLRGLPASLDSLETLVGLVTQIIWIAGPQHSVVNYPQWDYTAYIPNMPFAAYKTPPRTKGSFKTENDVVRALPGPDKTIKQILLIDALSSWRFTRLGSYYSFDDERSLKAISGFQRDLENAETEITRRNSKRSAPYSYLLPSMIPNSTNT